MVNRVLLPQPSSDSSFLTASFTLLNWVLCMLAWMVFLSRAHFPAQLRRQEFEDEINQLLQICGTLETLCHYVCSLCFTAPIHSFVAWLAPCLPVGKRHKRIKPLAGLCRVWDCQNTSSSAGVQPLALCRGSREMQGRRVLTARGAQGQGLFYRAGAAEPLWSTVLAFWPGAEVPFANERPPTAPSGWETQYPLDPCHLQMWRTHQWQ